MAELSSILLIAFSSLFVFNCSGKIPPGNPAIGGPPGLVGTTINNPLISDLYNDKVFYGRPTEGLLYFHPNHQGSPSLITNEAGTVESTLHYTPYGEVIRNDVAAFGADHFRKKYTGQEEDPETGLLYYNARYYDPMLGRFASQDTIVDAGAGNAGFNRYMYVGGNPVNYGDASGHEPVTIIMTLLIVGAIAGGGSAVSCGCSGIETLNAFGKGFTIGAISAAAGAGIGTAIVGLTGLTGVAAAVVGSFTGGFTAGFFNGAATTWVNGGSFEEGLFNGLQQGFLTGSMAALTAGIMYGLGEMFPSIGKERVGSTPNNTKIGRTYKWAETKINSVGMGNANTLGSISGNSSSQFIARVNNKGDGSSTSYDDIADPPPGSPGSTEPGFWDYTDQVLGFVNDWAPGPWGTGAGVFQAGLRWYRGDMNGAKESLYNSIPGFKKIKKILGIAKKGGALKKLKSLLNKRKKYFRLDKPTPHAPRKGSGADGTVMKPWHLHIGKYEIPINPWNKNWRFF